MSDKTQKRMAIRRKHRGLVSSQVYRSKHRIPPKHFCGDPDDLMARIAAANPTQELSLVEVWKRMSQGPERGVLRWQGGQFLLSLEGFEYYISTSRIFCVAKALG